MDLRTLRAMRKETQWGLRIKTGISQSKLSLLERGYIRPSEEEKKKIARALEVEPSKIEWPEEG